MSQQQTSEKKFHLWKYIFIPLIVILIPIIYNKLEKEEKKKETPRYSISDSHVINKDKHYITLVAANKSARKNSDLDIKIGNLKLNDICKIDKTNTIFQWKFNIKAIEPKIIQNIFSEGENEIQVGFSDKNLWDTHSIIINDLDILFQIPQKITKKKKKKLSPSSQEKEKEKSTPYSIPNKKDPLPSYYEAKGYCVVNKEENKNKNKSQAVLMATKCAQIVAKAELLEIINGIKIKESATIKDLILTDVSIQTQVEGVIKFAYQVGDPIITDDKVEVIVRVDKQEILNAITLSD